MYSTVRLFLCPFLADDELQVVITRNIHDSEKMDIHCTDSVIVRAITTAVANTLVLFVIAVFLTE